MTILSSTLNKSFVGFDALFDELNKLAQLKEPNYPSFNLEKLNNNKYKISIAVAGFSLDKLSVEVLDNLLTVKALSANTCNENKYIHKGIALRPFIKNFRLERNLKVLTSELHAGILAIYLEKIIPKEIIPIKIKINSK